MRGPASEVATVNLSLSTVLARLIADHGLCIGASPDDAQLRHMFLAWPQAAEEVVRLLERDQLTGIPKNPETILDRKSVV